METYKFITCAILLGAFTSVNTLQCYECVDCPDDTLSDDLLKTCDITTTTSAVTATTAAVDTTTVTTAGTTASASDTTTVSTAGTVTTTASSTASVSDPTTVSTAGSTAGVSDTTTVSTAGTVTSTAGSTAESTSGTSDATAEVKATRVRRNVLTNDGCSCNGETCACEDDADVIRAFQYADDVSTNYVCAKGTVKNDTGYEIVVRGCVPDTIEDVEFCTFYSNETAITSCSVCNIDKCNSGFVTHSSIALLLFVLTFALFTK